MVEAEPHWIGTCHCGWRESAETFEHLLGLARKHEAEAAPRTLRPMAEQRHLAVIELRPRRP